MLSFNFAVVSARFYTWLQFSQFSIKSLHTYVIVYCKLFLLMRILFSCKFARGDAKAVFAKNF